MVFGVACSLIAVFEGYNADAHGRGRRARHDAHRRHLRRRHAGARLHPHGPDALTRGEPCGQSRAIDISTGLFVLLGFAAILFLVTQITNREFSLRSDSLPA
ncbi:MAG: hypothetical protein MZV65_25630 [Chromatiales bacterium]|nr:hypothetical protein [Chromatiales bacterium]